MEMFLKHFDWQEVIALLVFIVGWFGYAHFSEGKNHNEKSLLFVTHRYRLRWMLEMLGRENRSLDAIVVGNLMRNITFFASTTIFILAALMSIIGYHERINDLVSHIPFAKTSTGFYWQMKVYLLLIIFIYGFFKFTWSMRLYNYVNIFLGAAPDYRENKEEHHAIAEKGAALLTNAARHYNNGMRAYYFGLGTLAWFIHPYAFMGATAWVVLVTHRREHRSSTLKYLS